jgi:hypothetical protein
MSIPAAGPQVLDHFGMPLVLEPERQHASGGTGRLVRGRRARLQ